MLRPDNFKHVAILRLFAGAREAAGTKRDEFAGATTVGAVIDAAVAKYGPGFEALLPTCRVWLNGDLADLTSSVTDRDEVAVLPPVSGGDGSP
jgi:molybdopterin converting factor small subunit